MKGTKENVKPVKTSPESSADQSHRKIRAVVDLLFDGIPYSEEVNEAHNAIDAAMIAEYNRTKGDRREDEALEELLSSHGKLSQMAELAGYPADSAERWRREGEAVCVRTVKREILRQRIRIYLTAALVSFGLVQLVWAGYRTVLGNISSALVSLLMMGVFLGLAYLPFRKNRETEKKAVDYKYDTEAYQYLRSHSDRFAKRLLNSIALLFAAVFIFLFSELIFYFFGNSKSAEAIESAARNSIAIEIPVFILLKNLMFCSIFQRRIKLPDREKYKKHLLGVTIASAAYWIVLTLFAILLRNSIRYPRNVFIISGFLFGLLMLVYNLTLRKKIMHRNVVVNVPRIVAFSAAGLVLVGLVLMQRDTWYTQSYINSVPVVEHNTHKIAYDESSGIYTITKTTDEFKILHLTDIHIGGSLYSYTKDMKALTACFAEIEYTHPDLVVVTGDMCFPMGIMSLSLNNSAPVHQFAAFMRNTGIPWAFTYGNHDTEAMSTLDKMELNEVYKSLSYKTSGNLLYPYVQPDIMGRNNQLIELRNADGSICTALFMIDSNAYTGEGLNVYDYIHDDQVDWYAGEVNRLKAEAGHDVNSLVFFHIPLQEYRTATELYLEGSSEVKYYFGENPGDHGGITNNLVNCSDYPSKLFDTTVALGGANGFFCGHDHYNNASLEYKGIRLTYGMSIDYLAMPGISKETKQRGAELITIHEDGSWDVEQIPLSSIQ